MVVLNLAVLECELRAYRKGSLTVRLNFAQHTMTWKESRQWCNNFVRTLSDDQVHDLHKLAQAFIADPAQSEPREEQSLLQDQTLTITVEDADGQACYEISQLDRPAWLNLKRAIERLSRSPFRL